MKYDFQTWPQRALRTLFVMMGALVATACSSGISNLPSGVEALPAVEEYSAVQPPLEDYRLGVLDEVRVTVFGEPDLSQEEVVIDLAGFISLPLVGQVKAFGKTTGELSEDLRQRLNSRYLRDAQVSVALQKATSYAFTIEGEVNKPGNYAIPGEATLLQSVAIGEGVTDQAALSQVVIFRTVNDKRYAARFNLNDIRAGKSVDPKLQSGDIVVVGYSWAKVIYKDIITALPGFAGVFIALAQNN